MAIDIKKLQQKALQTGKDFTKTAEGGGGWQPPPAGPCGLRFVGYFEVGEHERNFAGQSKIVKQVQLVFELSGKNYPPRDGVPVRMTITETDSRSPKANLIKLFNKMNYAGGATHFVQLLGNAYRGRVHHREYEANGTQRVYAGLRGEDGYSVGPPTAEIVGDDGEITVKPVKVAEALTDLKVFLWDNPDMEQWASIHIDGTFPAYTDDAGREVRPARSKNVIQEKIMSALNWQGSPMQLLLQDGALELDGEDAPAAPPPAKKPAAKKAARQKGVLLTPPEDTDDDPLADLDDDTL